MSVFSAYACSAATMCVRSTIDEHGETVFGKEDSVKDDARRLIQSATGAKRRHLARRKPIRGFFRVQFPPAGARSAQTAQKEKTRKSVSFLFGARDET